MSNKTKSKKFTHNVGKKFHEDGSVRKFPGNTFICHVPKSSPQFEYLLKIREILMSQPWAKKFSFLPPSSFHMTVFEGVCDYVRKSGRWTSLLPLDAPLEDVDELLISKWDAIEKPESFIMMAKVISIGGVITIQLAPKDEAMNDYIRSFRNLLSENYGIKMPGHNMYHFHISFAYSIEKLSFRERMGTLKFMKNMSPKIREEFGLLKTGTPELTFFSDMFKFAPSRAEAKKK